MLTPAAGGKFLVVFIGILEGGGVWGQNKCWHIADMRGWGVSDRQNRADVINGSSLTVLSTLLKMDLLGMIRLKYYGLVISKSRKKSFFFSTFTIDAKSFFDETFFYLIFWWWKFSRFWFWLIGSPKSWYWFTDFEFRAVSERFQISQIFAPGVPRDSIS